MGVIENDYNPFRGFAEDFEDNFVLLDYEDEIDDDDDDDDGLLDVDIPDEVHVPIRRPRKIRRRNPPIPMDFCTSGRSRGSRKTRRYLNVLELVGESGEDLEEMGIEDFCSQRVSAFAKLIGDPANVQLWDDFINCVDCADYVPEKTASEKPEDVPSDGGNILAEHPAFRELPCVQRFNQRHSTLLRKKLPMNFLSTLEDEVISFFVEWPADVFVTTLANSFHRRLLQSLCTYLDLVARSFRRKSDPHVEVTNPRPTFEAPPLLLTQYLAGTRCSK